MQQLYRRNFAGGILFLLLAAAHFANCRVMAVEIAGVDVNVLCESIDTTPQGEYVEATVPDTLDLAERGQLAVHALTSFLNPSQDYASYGQNFLNANPAYFSHFDMGPPNWGANVESLVMARQMSGSRQNLEIDRLTVAGMLTYVAGRDPKIPSAIDLSRIGVMALYQVDPQPDLITVYDELARREVEAANHVAEKGAYYWDPEPDLGHHQLGVVRYGWTPFVSGLAIHSLSRWSRYTKQDDSLDLCGELAEYAFQPKYWQPEVAPKAVVAYERAQFDGHHHSYLTFLKGLLCYAEQTNDARLKRFVRDGYEYFRTFGLARIGAFGETCSTGDMTFLAIKLSDLGVGDYWDDADQYVRNQLTEMQITDTQPIHELASKLPKGRGKNDFTRGEFNPDTESLDRAIERSVGAYWSDSSHPTLIPESCMLYTICCTGSCVPALYAAWDATVRCSGGNSQINLLLNRSAESLDVDSYLPYEGKVVIHNKTARRISVRIPSWVDLDKVESQLDGKPTDFDLIGRYCVFDDVKPKSKLMITFPMVETVEKWTLNWKEQDFWQECTNPGPHWKALDPPKQYTMRFRGNTLVDIEPRDTSLGVPLYQRSHLDRHAAPTKTTTRFVPSKTLDW
jgi:hypothetical protein